MHEYAIAQSIVEAVETEARRNGAQRVLCVTCRVGPLRQIDGWMLQQAFSIARHQTCCAAAELLIERTTMHCFCPDCNREFATKELSYSCAACGSLSRYVRGGDELELASLDVEVDELDEQEARL